LISRLRHYNLLQGGPKSKPLPNYREKKIVLNRIKACQ